jgi:hypothetical protein
VFCFFSFSVRRNVHPQPAVLKGRELRIRTVKVCVDTDWSSVRTVRTSSVVILSERKRGKSNSSVMMDDMNIWNTCGLSDVNVAKNVKTWKNINNIFVVKKSHGNNTYSLETTLVPVTAGAATVNVPFAAHIV